jgi:hypothetical protein
MDRVELVPTRDVAYDEHAIRHHTDLVRAIHSVITEATK